MASLYSKQDRDEFITQAAGKNIDEMWEDQSNERPGISSWADLPPGTDENNIPGWTKQDLPGVFRGGAVMQGQPEEKTITSTQDYNPRVKLFGWEFGESGSKARGATGLFNAEYNEKKSFADQVKAQGEPAPEDRTPQQERWISTPKYQTWAASLKSQTPTPFPEKVLDIADKRSWGFKLKEDVINKWFGKTKQKDKTTATGYEPKNAIGKEIQDKTTATGYARKNGEVEKGDLKDKTKATEPGLLPSTEKNSPWLSKLDTVTSAIDRAFHPAKQEAPEQSEGAGQGLQRPPSGYGL